MHSWYVTHLSVTHLYFMMWVLYHGTTGYSRITDLKRNNSYRQGPRASLATGVRGS